MEFSPINSKMKKNLISIHFDGPIAANHTVQLRTFSRTLDHIQTAIDRAYLDLKHGGIGKNARMTSEDYEPTDFLVQQTREGGFISDIIGKSDSKEIIERMNDAIAPAHEEAKKPVIDEKPSLIEEAEKRRKHFKSGAQLAISYQEMVDTPDPKLTRAYGDRSIVKEFDQIAAAIRARQNDGSSIEIDLYPGRALPTLVFDYSTAVALHKIVSSRSLGDPVEIPVTLRALDSGGGAVSKAKATNLISGKEFNLFIHTERGFSSLRKYLSKRNPKPFNVIACPVLEYDAFDPDAGDMYFIAISKEEVQSEDQ